MSLYYHKSETNIVLSGNTYPYKDAIKALGGRFDGANKTWVIFGCASDELILQELAALGACELPGVTPAADPAPSHEPAPVSLAAPVCEALPPQEVSPRDTWTIAQVVEAASKAIQLQFSSRIWIVGEVQNLGFKGGNCFLNLADPDPRGSQGSTISVSAMIWAQTIGSFKKKYPDLDLKEILQDGLKIQCSCQVQFYKNRGQLSLVILDIDPSYTKGALALAREAVLKDLRAKGLDQANKRLPLPRVPMKIGLVTAEGSRAVSDFLHQLEDGGYPGRVIFVPASMQGERVSPEISQAIIRLCLEDVDLIVITRGGGSAADLRWFDTKEAALAVAASKVPVIAAIGHHDDRCVVEEIAYLRQKTPTAAADFVLGCMHRFYEDMRSLSEHLSLALTRSVTLREREERTLSQALTAASFRVVGQLEQALSHQAHQLEFAVQNLWADHERVLTKLEQDLTRRDPTPWLEAGWTQLTIGSESTKLTSITQVEKGSQVSARLKDGKLLMEILCNQPKSHTQHS